MDSLQAVVMAGGEGTRLRPLTSNMPKPMLPVTNRPLMAHIIELLRRNGVTEIVATVQFLSSVIRNYFDDGSDFGVSLSYATEDVPLGTAGSVLGARELLSGRFLVISGDALTDIDLGEVLDWHIARGAAATLVLKRMQDPLEFGIVMTDDDGRIERFLEKPSWGQVFSDAVNTGMYVLEPEVLDLIPPDRPCDFSSELFPAMLDKGLPLYGFVAESYWTDVGTSEAYLAAQQDVLQGRVQIELAGFEVQPGLWLGEDVEVDPTATLKGPALIGDNCRVGPGASIGGGAVLGDNVIVAGDATVWGGVVMDGAHIRTSARLSSGVLGRGASLGEGAQVEEGAVLGDEVTVGAGALIKPRVKVYPSRTVEAGAIVSQSLVQERKASRSLFGARGVSGLVNIGLTPQVAVRLGMAYGTMLPRGASVITGRDASRAARTIKRALIAGLTATGVICRDLELMALPVTRFAVRKQQAEGGISVRTSRWDSEVVEIRLFDAEGADVSESVQRKIDRIFFREDYRRPGANRLGELDFPPHVLEQYTGALLGSIDLESVRRASLKVVVDYASGAASLIGPSLLGRLGCRALSVNAFTDEHRPVFGREHLERLLGDLREHVTKSGSDLGVLLEPGGETAHLVDGRGRLVSHEQALLAFLRHELERGAGTAAVPVSSSAAAVDVARDAGGELELTPVGHPALMAATLKPGIGFAGDSEGSLIFPAFMPAPDALMTFCKALEMIASSGRPLVELIDALPPSHVTTRSVRTPWQLKGTVMREIASEASPSELVLVEGVKIVERGRWALVIPAPDDPSCRIWAEAADDDASAEHAQSYVERVERVVKAAADKSTN